MAEITKSYENYWDELKSSSSYHPGNRLRYALIRLALEKYLGKIDKQNLSIVDVGCGDASLLREVSLSYQKADLTGIDVSNLVIAKNKGLLPSAQFFARDAGVSLSQQEPLGDSATAFDVVLSSEVIEHVENDQIFLNNLSSLCKPNGLIILTTQSGPRYRMDREVLGHLRHYSRESLSNLVSNTDLIIVSFKQAGFPWLNLQKKLVDMFFDTVKASVLDADTLSFSKKLAMGFLTFLYKCSLPNTGPQLILILRKQNLRS